MVEATHLCQHQSLVLVKAEVTLLWEVLNVPTAAEFIRKMCPARRSVCFRCNKRGHFKTMCHSSRRTQSHPSSQHKVVQEVQAHDDQNTGNKTKNVDIVEMIRSMGLCAKNPSQFANVQEMSIVQEDVKPVFYSPVQPKIVMTIWDQVCSVMDPVPEVCVTTPIEHCIFETKKVNMIMVHDMELKSAHYSNVTINGQMVQIKQYTGAEVNMMSKCVFDRLSNGTTRNTVLLNKTKMVKISEYSENSIEYIGTCVFKVSHNNQHRDVLFFITNMNDAKVILGAKSCQEFNLVKIVCNATCSCKTSKTMSINQEFPVGLSISDTKPKIFLPPVDLNMKIDVTNPKTHIMNLFPDLFEGVGTMENVQVHLDVNPEIEPVVQVPRKIPHSMMEPLKAELDQMIKLGVIHKLHINEATDWVHNLVLVRKPNGKLRVCLDPRTINKALCFNIHNAKTFSELISRIGKVMYVSKIDTNSGFWTLPMDPDSQLLTTFNTPWGRFCFLKMPFRLNQSQYFFEFWMDAYFGNLNEGTQVIADDVKIHGPDEATHNKYLIQVLNQCRKVSLKLNSEKCIFKAESIPFFGHIISRDGIKPDPKKMDAIRMMMTPTSKLELQSFLGLCNYLAIYVPSLSAVLQPLCELTKKDTDFQWNSQYDILYQ